jgi:CheY-like chemotaxis protein
MLTQALISKGLETVQLSDAVIIAPENAHGRSALLEQLTGLVQAARHLGFSHLENALVEAVDRLERESFSMDALDAVRALAGRYVSLAAMPAGSGTHMVGLATERAPAGEVGLRGRRVLVAVEQAPVRWSYVGRLRDAGARVMEARDGIEALELARSEPLDLMMADVDLPKLDGLGLCAAIRRDRSLDALPVVLLAARPDGEPPRAMAEAGTGSQGLVDALLEVLQIPGALEEAPRPLAPVAPDEASMDDTDPQERENVRAQSAVAMHQEPANRAPRLAYPIWRVSPGPGAAIAVTSSGFDPDLRMISRIVGAGFILLLAGTVAILLRDQRLSPAEGTPVVSPVQPAPVTETEGVVIEVPAPTPERPEAIPGLHAFSGELRNGIDPSLQVDEGQGVLELDGPTEVTVDVDGVDHGSLPIELVLDPGRHTVRYHVGARATVRFYTVEPGATRTLRVVTLPGGLIDAR